MSWDAAWPISRVGRISGNYVLSAIRVEPKIAPSNHPRPRPTTDGEKSMNTSIPNASIPNASIPNVILVHGAWADGSTWSKVIPLLARNGLTATAVQLPLTGFEADVAAVQRAIALAEGEVVLVGHSYAGAVIGEAGNDPKVARMVYIDAFAPDAGESAGTLFATFEAAPLNDEIRPDAQGYLKLSRDGIFKLFAQDLDEAEKAVIHATQGPL